MLQDLLELIYTVTRLKSVPALRDSQELPEAERTRGAALADQLSVPALARAWQMLLKGVGEVETAPDRRAAAEMVLIRLCHVSDLPPPGDLVRRLAGARHARPSASARTGAVRAVARGRSPAARRSPRSPIATPRLASFRDVTALVAERREAMLHAHLIHSVHLVRFAPPVIELRPQPEAPRDLAARLGALLTRRPARAGPSRCPPPRASRPSPSRAPPPTPPGARPPPIIRWCARSWTRSPARGSTRCTTRPPMPMVCRPIADSRRRCRTLRRDGV